MDEDVVLQEAEGNPMESISHQLVEDSSAHVMPLLYIQGGKLHSTQASTISGQTLVSQAQPHQITAILNPVNSQLVAGQNKVIIQGTSVLHRPVNALTSPVVNATSQAAQKHVLLRKSNASTAQILPLNSAQGNVVDFGHTQASTQPTYAYLQAYIKPNIKARESVVVPAAALNQPLIQKQKLLLAPMQLSSGPTSTATISIQSQPQNPMTNLLLPLNIPHQNGNSKPNMYKIANGPINSEQNKNNLTVLRESKTTNATSYPPPLHPISQLYNVGGKNSSDSPDSIKITENPDSAVITPIPKKEEGPQLPEKRKKTMSNILRTGERRPKKQNLSKTLVDNMDNSFPINSDHEQDRKKSTNDDDITLIKVVPNEDNQDPDDDVKIEIIKTREDSKDRQSPIVDNKKEQKSETNFDATKALDWKDGVGSLPGSSLKFRMNEFGIMEVVEEEDKEGHKDKDHGDKENVCLRTNSSKSSSSSTTNEKKSEERKTRTVSLDTFYCCEGCGCHGLAAEFESPISCSPSCTEIIERKKQQQLIRKETDINRRKRKRLLQEQQQSKETTEESTKSEKKYMEKPQIDSDSDTREASETESHDMKVVEPKIVLQQYPWQTGKNGFSWAKYLEYCKAKAAPVKLFKDPYPYSKNQFRVGMKLEAIDPEHPARFCVVTVAEVMGYRMRLHFDGYPETYDFWVNADSMDIFPACWAEKNGHKLDPPKGYVPSNFNWNGYLKICKASAAPKNIFTNNKSSVFPFFRKGMKLEAVDRKHSSLVCVATIADIVEPRILVHFDSWDEVYDYWADPSSPYIHPVGWCNHNGRSLTPPNNYKDPKSFTWLHYLRETNSIATPSRSFKQRPACGYQRGMKLEAVDKRVPQLIRVATVEDIKGHMIKIRFDGWPENHGYWVDDDSPDIHPISWCHKSGHVLQPPLTSDVLSERTECGTPGCRGIGHIKGPKFVSHNSASGCPYSPQNLHRTRPFTDRLTLKQNSDDDEDDDDEKLSDKLKALERTREKSQRLKSEDKVKMPSIRVESPTLTIKRMLLSHKMSKRDKRCKQEKRDDELSDNCEKSETSERSTKSKMNNSDGHNSDEDENPRKRKKSRKVEPDEPPPMQQFSSQAQDSSHTSYLTYMAHMPDKQLRKEIYQSVYNPGYNPTPEVPQVWAKHSYALNRVVSRQSTNPRRWNTEELIKFIQTVPNCKDVGNAFRKHSIDGESFLMLTQEDLIAFLGLKLGPAIKLYNSIVLLRRKAA